MIIRYSRNNLECYFRVNSGLSISISISEIVINRGFDIIIALHI